MLFSFFKFSFFIDSLCISIPLISPSLFIRPPTLQPPLQDKTKSNLEEKRKRKEESRCRSCSVHSESRSPSVCTLLFASVHGVELLVWFEVPGFCCLTSTGPSQGVLLDILPLSCVMGILGSTGPASSCAPTGHRWDRYWDGPTHSSGSGSGWLVAGLIIASALLHPQHEGELSSTAIESSSYVVSSKRQGQFSCSHVLEFNPLNLQHQGQLCCLLVV